ncbi:hypothetical protein BpHYR1_046489 [Brachionus plicatilis]|uniref:Uncharacterized protein n=1 Tax=Brachionus plicatilis TaxID=10195 RepID=A0A3M7PSI4_BRAPC|nr:hypothetical protein BpHYR1_046489 [Brachionus plicatilis]
MLRSVIHSIDSNWFCEKCKCPIVDENHDSIACDYCYKLSHFKCVVYIIHINLSFSFNSTLLATCYYIL